MCVHSAPSPRVFTSLPWTLKQSTPLITQTSGHEMSVCTMDLCVCVCLPVYNMCMHVQNCGCLSISAEACGILKAAIYDRSQHVYEINVGSADRLMGPHTRLTIIPLVLWLYIK